MFSALKIQRLIATLVVFCATSVAFAPPASSYGGESSLRCLAALANLNLSDRQLAIARAFSRFEFAPLNNGEGFSLELKGKPLPLPTRVVEIPLDPYDATFLTKSLWRNIWSYRGKKYEFVSVGLKNLQDYSNRVNQEVLAHIMEFPNQRLVINYAPLRTYIGARIDAHKWAYLKKVLLTYKERKTVNKIPYISAERLKKLEDVNRLSDNNDVTALLKLDANSPARSSFLGLSEKDIEDNLLTTGQVTYPGYRYFLRPTLRELYEAAGIPYNNINDKHPLEHSIANPDLQQEFRKSLYQRFPAYDTVEINRHALFDSRLPRPVYAAYILDLIQRAFADGKKHILISVDEKTKDIFGGTPEDVKKGRSYGFLLWAPFPRSAALGENEMEEYVYYLDEGSPQHNLLINVLTEKSKNVTKSWESLP